MDNNIKCIFFDLGGTLRMTHRVESHEQAAKKKLHELCKVTDKTPDEFYDFLQERFKPYREEIFRTNREANDFDFWHKWMLPELDTEYLKTVCHDLSFYHRECAGLRCITEGGIEVIKKFCDRGYKLGIISNLNGETEIFNWVKEYDIEKYFDTIIVSAVCGLRKPDPEIYRLACREIGVAPENCVSIADNPDRDITGAKAAGIYKNILYISKEKLAKKTITDDNRPDYIVHAFSDILNLDIFN